jgi:hypothetical protein
VPSNNGYGIAFRGCAPDKLRAVGLELQVADGLTLHGDHVRGPNGVSLSDCAGAWPAARRRNRSRIRFPRTSWKTPGWAASAAWGARQISA